MRCLRHFVGLLAWRWLGRTDKREPQLDSRLSGEVCQGSVGRRVGASRVGAENNTGVQTTASTAAAPDLGESIVVMHVEGEDGEVGLRASSGILGPLAGTRSASLIGGQRESIRFAKSL